MKKGGMFPAISSCFCILLFAVCPAAGGDEPKALDQASPESYSPPELKTKNWNNYLYGGTVPLIKQKKNAEALARLVWFWNHILEHRPGMCGVRLSFALSIWKQLADQYPPAFFALKRIRDNAGKKVWQGDVQALIEADSINKTLGEPGRSVSLFKELDRLRPDLAKKMEPRIEHTLLENGEYALVLKYGPAPEKKWEKLQKTIKTQISPAFAKKVLTLSPGNKPVSPDGIKQFQERMIVYFQNMQIVPLVRFCNACGKKALAAEIETTFRKLSEAALAGAE